jgi:hypothetical protein
MKITADWHGPLRLVDGSADNLIYRCVALDKIPQKAGVYVFGRKYGSTNIPIYIGQADRLKTRVEQQLNYVPLMKGIENAPSGRRILMYSVIDFKPGQQKKKVLGVVEGAFMKSALASGYELLNKQGTKTKVHEITSNGGKSKRPPFPKRMNVERK